MSRCIVVANQNAAPAQLADIATTVQDGGGHIQQAWGDSVLIAECSPAVQNALSSQTQGVAFLAEALAPDPSSLNISDDAIVMAAAWNLMQSPPFDAAWANFGPAPSTSGLPEGGCGGGEQPTSGPLLPTDLLAGLLGMPANNQVVAPLVHRNRRALVNTIGIAILEIDGPPGTSARLQPQDRVTAIASVSRGLQILTALAPAKAHLVFDVAIRRTQLSVDPTTVPFPANPAKPTAAEYEACEKVWRDPALANLSASSSRDGFGDVVRSSNFLFNIDWGFVLVLTKYRAAFPGYAPNYRDVVIAYGMQPDLLVLPAIIAHEIGHTVGAFDEYGPNCRILHKCGFNNGPNLNCEIGNEFGTVDCLMKNNAAVVCLATQGHFGWGDQDFDGVLDPFDSDFILL